MAIFPAVKGGAVGLGPHEDSVYEDGLEGDESDIYLDIKVELAEALDYIQSSGTFASQGELPYVDPQIKVHDVGAITLPMQESQARQMME